jgi:Ca2+-binding RTX toxin-like protein
MSFHFLNGTTYASYEDTAPDTGHGAILVDRLAAISTSLTNTDALTLEAAPWLVTVNGNISAVDGDGIVLKSPGPGLSTVTIGAKANIVADHAFGIGVSAAHRANITNAGHITGHLAGIGETGDGNFRIANSKTGEIVSDLFGIVVESLGTHTIVNAGKIESSFTIRTASGIEHVTNSGTLIGYVDLGDGNDSFTNFKKVGKIVKNGIVDGQIDLGAGNDSFRGGNKVEVVRDSAGNDNVKFGGGDDFWVAHFGADETTNDVVDGGRGRDTYHARDAGVLGVDINLDTVEHFGRKAMSAHTTAMVAADETIKSFENAYGTDGMDTLFGSKGANTLDGGAGIDAIAGFGGADQLYGGADVDGFSYFALKDSGPTRATRDTIHDFELGDRIHLTELNHKLGDIIDAFLGVDVAFTGHAGDLRAVTVGDDTIVQLDVNGDQKTDFSIALDGHIALTSGNFFF